MFVTVFLWSRHRCQWWSVSFCLARLKSLSLLRISLFSSEVTQGLSLCRVRIRFVDIDLLAASSKVWVNCFTASSTSLLSITSQLVCINMFVTLSMLVFWKSSSSLNCGLLDASFLN